MSDFCKARGRMCFSEVKRMWEGEGFKLRLTKDGWEWERHDKTWILVDRCNECPYELERMMQDE